MSTSQLRLLKGTGDKCWFNGQIRRLIAQRQKAFYKGDLVHFRLLRNKVIRAIESAKQSFYAEKVRTLQKSNPRTWHRGIQNLVNVRKSDLALHIEGIDSGRHDLIANKINDHFIGFPNLKNA